MYGEPVPLNFTRKRRYPGDQPELMGADTRYSPPMPPPLMPPPLTGMEVDPGPPTRGPDGYSWENLVFETIDPAVPSLAVNLPVPLDRAGLVVGVRGNTVRSLESQCGVEISVAVRDDDPLRDPSTNTTHVHVRGPKYGVYEAMQRIGDLFRYRHPLPEMHTPPPPPVVPSELLPPPLPVMNHHSAYEANPESLSAVDKPNLVSFDILDDHCGLVIGRRGRMLADLREESGASIELVSGDDPTQPKKCLVWSSDPDKVDDALVRLARVLSRLPDALPVPPPKNPEAEERALNPRWVEEDYRGGPPTPSVPVAGLPRVDVSAATAAVAVSHFDSPEAVDACAPNRDTPLDTPVEYYVDVPADKAELLTDRTMQDLRRRSQCYVELMPIDDEQESSEDAPLMWRRLMLYGMPVPIHYAIVKLKDIMKGEVVEVGDSANTKVKEYPKIGEVDSGTPSTQYSRMQDEADAEKGQRRFVSRFGVQWSNTTKTLEFGTTIIRLSYGEYAYATLPIRECMYLRLDIISIVKVGYRSRFQLDYIKTEGVHQRVFRWGIGNRFRSANANRYQPVHLERIKEVTLNDDYYDSPDPNIRWDDYSECWEVYWYEHEKLNAKPFPVKKFGIKWSKEEAKKFYEELKESGRVHARPSHKGGDDSIMWDERMQGWAVSYWQNGR
ncbi:hypothetical protein FOL46_008821 [Perkinsus olseni]|uniref:K Homology domain-containing protein n=1 Tax=Perkinsus olseni TaxID=32597 RepID=A0A7J6MLQ5_PEROL|nr:hypothetical protein FOL46_008821 [Perkinsus olseni]